MSTAAVIVIIAVALVLLALIVAMGRRAAAGRRLEDMESKALHDGPDFHRSHAEASRQETDPPEEAIDPDRDRAGA